MKNDPKTIALYIDCENISHKQLDRIIENLSSYGEIIIRRAYGNWQKENLKAWNEKLYEYALKPIHHLEYAKGKNSSDMSLAIDVMNMLSRDIDIFAFASSDSDFTPLVMELREHGKKVLCFGESKATQLYKKICSDFICLDTPIGKKTQRELRKDTKLVNILRKTVDEEKNEKGKAIFSSVEEKLIKKGFATKIYGYEKLSDLLKEIDLFDIEIKGSLHKALLWDKRSSIIA
ncbi:NYN domain-containing protein [Sulfuricurvum sp.]|uniref:NYN domain-containing protein n=1 Tax=Sulfuricurvum sp. TaxID=2025608 RepID=UPI0026121416|nr:NYN domain-containing protein [Sulfuricurvum sp.]MDD3594929.1 NYN domain-containing protein [Sulfuricurvum sp.]